MLLDYYGFRDHPFQMTPDPRLFFASTVHRRAYAHLTYGLAQREGFIIITGEVGAGKTTLVERLCGELDTASFTIARIVTTQVSGEDLLRLVADAFGVPMEGSKASLLKGISETLRSGAREGRRHLLIVDEAQGLVPEALEELRMLSNVTDGGQALLQTILLGQPELKLTIASPSLDQLRQRVLASYHLAGLSREETHAYVEHRLRAVGWDGRPAWDPAALDAVHRRSGGIPRRINRLCARVMLSGALEEADRLTAELVEATAQELEEDLGGGLVRPGPSAAHAAAAAIVLGAQRNGPLPAEGAAETGGNGQGGRHYLDLVQRIEALEAMTARRERVFNRLMDLFADLGGPRR
jgi:general secretion pathway protein A